MYKGEPVTDLGLELKVLNFLFLKRCNINNQQEIYAGAWSWKRIEADATELILQRFESQQYAQLTIIAEKQIWQKSY